MTDSSNVPRAPESPPAAPEVPARLRWCPVRPLAPRHRPRILAHLMALEERDRYLRFGHAASDGQVSRYVDQLDFDRDELFGVFNRRLELVAMMHLAYLGQDLRRPTSAEFGVSVLPRARGRGLGKRLFDLAALHARNRGVDTMVIHALSENSAMLRIARQAGAVLDRAGPESTATLKLPPEDLASHLEEMVDTHASEVDYRVKHHVRMMGAVAQTLRELLPEGTSVAGQ